MNDHVRLHCLRHAESENVVTGTAGAQPDAPLTARGRTQATEAGLRLGDEGITHVYAGTAVRARQTAAIVARTLGLTSGVTVVPGLEEVGLGRLEGSRDPAVRARTAEVLRAWVVDGDLDEAVGDGESGHTVTARVTAALTSLVTAHPGGTIAVVGHVASLTTGLGALCGLGGRVWGAPLPHAVPFLVEYGPGRAWRCRNWPGEC
ncbi:histidine phosphatase family protein [Nonomuraea sp. NPDC048882]|uniref:histidine phosphatase family protein n=1 Tax=Nonomuraea sp. NPDC048882 TaxID=3154347 RepID=UPI0033C39089